MRLTVATAVLNVGRSCGLSALEQCVRSVASCGEIHEHVIFDGGSTDGTFELLERLSLEFPTIRLHSRRDRGIYDALNNCLECARGDYFLVLGADDRLLPDEGAVTRCLDQASYRNLDLLMSRVELDGGSLSPVRPRGATCCHQGLLMRTEALRQQGGFDISYCIAADRKMYLHAHWDGLLIGWTDLVFAHYACEGVSSKARGIRQDEFNRAFAEILCRTPEAYSRAMSRGIAPVGSCLRLMRSRSVETRRFGLHLLFRRLVCNKFRTSGYSRHCLFGLPLLTRRRPSEEPGGVPEKKDGGGSE